MTGDVDLTRTLSRHGDVVAHQALAYSRGIRLVHLNLQAHHQVNATILLAAGWGIIVCRGVASALALLTSECYLSCMSLVTDLTPSTALATRTASLISARELTKPLN
jgi:hypothetical protein